MEYWIARAWGRAALRGKVYLVTFAERVVEASPDFAWALGEDIGDVIARLTRERLAVYVRQSERTRWRPVNED